MGQDKPHNFWHLNWMPRPAAGIKVAVFAGDLKIPATWRCFQWASRLATSRKLPFSMLGGAEFCRSSFFAECLSKEVEDDMEKNQNKSGELRRQIIQAAQAYKEHLVGKVFLYVYGNDFFEVVFQTDQFLHLTGVSSMLGARDFYQKAKNSTLSTGQIFFDTRHPYRVAKKKLPCLLVLHELTNSLVIISKDTHTGTLLYKLSVSNLEFTIGLTENRGQDGSKINDWFLPRTLRVKDKPVENSSCSEFVDFIFAKEATSTQYTEITYRDAEKVPPQSIRMLLSSQLQDALYNTENKVT